MMRIQPLLPSPSPWPLLAVAVALAASCATAGARKYPPRRPGCELQVFKVPDIPVGAWEDIGIAEAGCYLDESEVACLHRLRVEACRMGGDILYAVPKRAARPTERAMVMRAKVAHSLAPPSKTPEPPPPATMSTVSTPVVPLAPPGPLAPRTDAGTD